MAGSHDEYDRHVEDLYREARIEPPWTRVWQDGVDITDTVPPDEWPWPYNKNAPHPNRPRRKRGAG
ncbi:MAG: hypothetical protein JWM49_1565 [Microbacteriaceae bacterium]|nr:hypothetical protein [Microbacteriaceae bacterium]